MNRSDIKKTPGRLIYSGVSMFAKLNTFIEEKPVLEMFQVGTDAHGEIDERQKEAYMRVTITPDGRLTSGLAAVLWPRGNPVIGSTIFSDSDVPLVIHGQDASLETYTAAALETMPALKFSSVEAAVGPATFLCLRGNAMNWSDANSLVTEADTAGTMTDAGFSPGLIITQSYTATWGAISGFSSIDTFDGFNVEFNVAFSDDSTDKNGLMNRRLKSVSCRVRCNPIGPTRQQILANLKIQGSGAGRGKSRLSSGADFTITGEDAVNYFTLKNAILTDKVQRWGSEQLRNGDVAWIATRLFPAGVPAPLFVVLP